MNDRLIAPVAEDLRQSSASVGILMSVYQGDEPKYLHEALESITRGQIRRPDKVVLVQDGPISPALREVIRFWKEDFGAGFVVIECSVNRGLAVALNRGLQELDTSFIARMDADDVALPERLTEQLTFMEQNPQIDLLGSTIIEINESSRPTGKVVSYPLDHESCLNFFGKRNPIAHPTAFFKREFFEKAGSYPNGPESKTDEDTLLWRSAFINGCRIANLPQPLLKFRVSDAFYRKRRNGIEYALRHFRNRIQTIRLLKLSPVNYIWACAYMGVNVAPASVKKFLYRLR
jgi:glycosyltransferase involved in cell wall biosynthesis